tara:strand:+ start:45 stop:1166 length:1122 start_codon:yes stop_codon:yes gene_type:complete
MTSKMWIYDEITSVNIEISSLCNAACPWCPRYEDMSTVVNKQLDPAYVPVSTFKEWFPEEFVSRIKFWTFTGDYGDAGTNPELPEVLRYILKHNPSTRIQINTNGGMKAPRHWKEIGEILSGTKGIVIFSIDGLEDTNHIYRRNVKWEKVMANAEAYIATGAEAWWDFLQFKHNIHQVDEVQSLADSMGFTEVHFKYPHGFENGNMIVKDKNFIPLYEIEPINEDQISRVWIPLHGKKAEDLDYESIREDVENFFKDKEGEIKCFSQRNGDVEIRVSSWGAVYPCSMFGHLAKYPRENMQFNKAQMIDIFKDKNISLKERTLKEILNADPYEFIYGSWKKKSCLACWGNCGVGPEKTPVMQQIYKKDKIYGTT